MMIYVYISYGRLLFFLFWRLSPQGNFKTFESVRSEQLKNQKRAFEAEKAKREHMQEFVDKFRCNAKRASLVQSRIKALEKMEVRAALRSKPPLFSYMRKLLI